uniref:Uncharacterized protein n=1 Tax=Anguilla anguilla TaxID=7936 RepID=A0A0E9TEL2_ANGAN
MEIYQEVRDHEKTQHVNKDSVKKK